MERKKSLGIVLKKQVPRRQKISLLDRHFGRIEAVPMSMHAALRMGNGAVVEYTLEKKQPFLLHDITLLESMSEVSPKDLLFFHHLLEMSYYGIPLEGQAEDIFELLVLTLRNLDHICVQSSRQKLVVSKLFLLMGADVNRAVEPILQQLSQVGELLQWVALDIDEENEQALDVWIYQYIQHHPCAHLFKTIQFLTDGRR